MNNRESVLRRLPSNDGSKPLEWRVVAHRRGVSIDCLHRSRLSALLRYSVKNSFQASFSLDLFPRIIVSISFNSLAVKPALSASSMLSPIQYLATWPMLNAYAHGYDKTPKDCLRWKRKSPIAIYNKYAGHTMNITHFSEELSKLCFVWIGHGLSRWKPSEATEAILCVL